MDDENWASSSSSFVHVPHPIAADAVGRLLIFKRVIFYFMCNIISRVLNDAQLWISNEIHLALRTQPIGRPCEVLWFGYFHLPLFPYHFNSNEFQELSSNESLVAENVILNLILVSKLTEMVTMTRCTILYIYLNELTNKRVDDEVRPGVNDTIVLFSRFYYYSQNEIKSSKVCRTS